MAAFYYETGKEKPTFMDKICHIRYNMIIEIITIFLCAHTGA